MRLNRTFHLGSGFLSLLLLAAPFSVAQQKFAVPQANLVYDVSRESVVQGTVISYTAVSAVAPIGPHAKIQTSSGVVDVHLGNASFMKQNDVFLAAGDSVSIVGETQTIDGAPIFLARVLRKGSQTVTLRNLKGIPFVAKPAPNAKPRAVVGGAR